MKPSIELEQYWKNKLSAAQFEYSRLRATLEALPNSPEPEFRVTRKRLKRKVEEVGVEIQLAYLVARSFEELRYPRKRKSPDHFGLPTKPAEDFPDSFYD